MESNSSDSWIPEDCFVLSRFLFGLYFSDKTSLKPQISNHSVTTSPETTNPGARIDFATAIRCLPVCTTVSVCALGTCLQLLIRAPQSGCVVAAGEEGVRFEFELPRVPTYRNRTCFVEFSFSFIAGNRFFSSVLFRLVIHF